MTRYIYICIYVNICVQMNICKIIYANICIHIYIYIYVRRWDLETLKEGMGKFLFLLISLLTFRKQI